MVTAISIRIRSSRTCRAAVVMLLCVQRRSPEALGLPRDVARLVARRLPTEDVAGVVRDLRRAERTLQPQQGEAAGSVGDLDSIWQLCGTCPEALA